MRRRNRPSPLFYWKTQGALRCARTFYRSTMKSYSQCQTKTESQYMETGSLLCTTRVHYLSLWEGQCDCLIWKCELATAFFHADLITCVRPLVTIHCNIMLLIAGHRNGPIYASGTRTVHHRLTSLVFLKTAPNVTTT